MSLIKRLKNQMKRNKIASIGGVYKPRGQTRGEGVVQMATTINNSYFVKVSTLGEGGQNCPKLCPRGLYTPHILTFD